MTKYVKIKYTFLESIYTFKKWNQINVQWLYFRTPCEEKEEGKTDEQKDGVEFRRIGSHFLNVNDIFCNLIMRICSTSVCGCIYNIGIITLTSLEISSNDTDTSSIFKLNIDFPYL